MSDRQPALGGMKGVRHSVVSTDGVRIGLLTAGTGSPLLLVHGGMGRIERWAPLWEPLTEHWTVTAMDRRGRGTSGDSEIYSADMEAADIAVVAAEIASSNDGPIDVFAHSIGATFTVNAGASSESFRKAVLYEPPGPAAVSRLWVDEVNGLVASGQVGRAVVSFLMNVIGLSREQVEALRDAPGGGDVLPIAAATLPREAHALETADLSAANLVRFPVLLLLGRKSPPWAAEITKYLSQTLPSATVSVLEGQGHEAIDRAPQQVVQELIRFLNPSS